MVRESLSDKQKPREVREQTRGIGERTLQASAKALRQDLVFSQQGLTKTWTAINFEALLIGEALKHACYFFSICLLSKYLLGAG